MTRLIPLVLACCVASLLAGCGCPTTHVPMDQLVAEYNANAAAVPKLESKVRMRIILPRKGELPIIWGSTLPGPPLGYLQLGKDAGRLGPYDFVLTGKEAGQDIFRLGCNAEENSYYLSYGYGGHAGMWWGRVDLAGAPGVEKIMPADPTQVLSVLGVTELPTDMTRLPIVGMRMQRDDVDSTCAYVLTFVDRQSVSNRIIFRREMYFTWSDTQPRRLYKVILLDGNGDAVMIARVKDYKAIETAPGATTKPVMPTDIQIDWPATAASIHMVLFDMNTIKGEPSIASMTPQPKGEVIQVDKGIAPKPLGGETK